MPERGEPAGAGVRCQAQIIDGLLAMAVTGPSLVLAFRRVRRPGPTARRSRPTSAIGIGQAVVQRSRRSAGQQIVGLALVDARSGGPASLTGALRLAAFQLLSDAVLSLYVVQPMARALEAARAERRSAVADPPVDGDVTALHGGELVVGPGCLAVIAYVVAMLVPLERGRGLPQLIAGTVIVHSLSSPTSAPRRSR